MNRREAIKIAGLTALAVTVSAEANTTMKNTKNRKEMSPKNPAKLEKGELKHTPLITIKDKDAKGYTMVEISVGQGGIIHPSTASHWIDFIELYADGKLVGKTTLEAEISRGATSFALKLDSVKELKAKSGCNLHGIWTSSLKV